MVYGEGGIRQYYGYTKKQAEEMYKRDNVIFVNEGEKMERKQIKVYENIRKARKELGMTREAFAQMMNLSVSSIYFYEHAKQDPSLYGLVQMAETLGITIDELVFGKE